MLRYRNECCGCATDGYPCLGKSCPNRRVPVYYCDRCREEIEDDVYEADGEDLCEYCLCKKFRKDVETE